MNKLVVLCLSLFVGYNCSAASVCILSAAEDTVVCDGKTLQKIADNTESFSSALKVLVDQGYKIVSQGGGDKSNYQIWTLVR